MQIIFVSSITSGGSGLSQRQLARRLSQRGHGVEILSASPDSRIVRPLYLREVDLSTRLRSSVLRPALLALQRPMGRSIQRVDTPDYPTWFSAVPENGYRSLRARQRPDVVIANSIGRVTWRRLRGQLRATNIPSVLYLREVAGLGHLSVTKAPPDLLLANADSIAQAARGLGYECSVVPSVVELDRSKTDSSREAVVLVNPIPLLGGDRLWPLARARPDIPFIVFESGSISETERDAVRAELADHPNVTLEPFSTDPSSIYSRARILLVPHRVDNRPRVVLEAQSNGIPVLASAFPGLVESVGAGGLLVDNDADPSGWIDALSRMWDDSNLYQSLVDAARLQAERPEADCEAIVERFEELLGTIL